MAFFAYFSLFPPKKNKTKKSFRYLGAVPIFPCYSPKKEKSGMTTQLSIDRNNGHMCAHLNRHLASFDII